MARDTPNPEHALPAVSGRELPKEPTTEPSAAEWKAGQAVRVTRGDPGPCKLVLVREWLRLTCPELVAAGLVAGAREGVAVRVTGMAGFVETSAVTSVILPIWRDSNKIVSFARLEQDYMSFSLAHAGTLSVVWRAHQEDPVIVMNGLPPRAATP